jgi:two-component system cell cycle response regulator DivK
MEETKKPSKKILVVEDNQDSRELVVKILKNKGYQIIEAVDGEEALEKVSTEKPDLILMDISLPKLDGYEVAKRLKDHEEFKHIPVVAFTAHAMKGDREKFISIGFEGYISKPINIHELPNQIRAYLKGKWESILDGKEE